MFRTPLRWGPSVRTVFGMATMTLWRAAEDDSISDCASFATSRATAEAYLANPGFGGRHLYRAEVEIDPAKTLDLIECDDAIEMICEVTGLDHPGAIGPDEWVPRISYTIRDAGYEWVRVRESYPAETETWIFVGSDDPEMEEVV